MSGSGKRFIDAGYKDPKPLILVDGKPIIAYVISMFKECKDISFICKEEHIANTKMEQIIKKECKKGKIFCVQNDLKKGPVGALLEHIEIIDDDKELIISYCDFFSDFNLKDFLSFVRSLNLDGAIVCYTGFHPHMLGNDNYAYLTLNAHDDVVKVNEKIATKKNKFEEIVSNGIYYFKSGALFKKYCLQYAQTGPEINSELYVSLLYNNLLTGKGKVGYYLTNFMLQWGTPFDLQAYQEWANYFKNKTIPQPKIKIKNYVTILPMAGNGSRFKERGYHKPKPMLEIDESLMFLEAVKCLPETEKIYFICLSEHIKKFQLQEKIYDSFPGSEVFSLPSTTDGQARTCQIGIDHANLDSNQPIIISACDNGIYFDENKFSDIFNKNDADVIVFSFRNNPTTKNNPNMYSWLTVDELGFVNKVSTKKFTGSDPMREHAIIGTMIFKKLKYFTDGFLENIKLNSTTNNEFYVDDVIARNIECGLRVRVFEVLNYICWGTPDDYETYLYWQNFFNLCTWHPYRK